LGLRSLPADGHTVAGTDDSGQVYILATHSGITLGPLLGRLAAQEIVQERLAPELSDFRPQRFIGTSAFPQVAPARQAGEQ
jgi:glycine/D-amino acid oxidase-like deaminating enzyme